MVAYMRTRNLEHNESRRSAIIEAASACFVLHGFHATSMKEVCIAAGMSPGTLYHYYRSKSEIIAGIVEEESLSMRDLLAPIADADDFIVVLFQTLDQIVGHISERDLVLYAEVAAEILRQPVLREQVRAMERETQEVLANAIVKAQRAGTVERHLNASHMANIINGLIDGLLSRATLHGLAQLRLELPSVKQALARIFVELPDSQ
jgi:TetR/AcrR family transcriptional regulator, repressor for uid operon